MGKDLKFLTTYIYLMIFTHLTVTLRIHFQLRSTPNKYWHTKVNNSRRNTTNSLGEKDKSMLFVSFWYLFQPPSLYAWVCFGPKPKHLYTHTRRREYDFIRVICFNGRTNSFWVAVLSFHTDKFICQKHIWIVKNVAAASAASATLAIAPHGTLFNTISISAFIVNCGWMSMCWNHQLRLCTRYNGIWYLYTWIAINIVFVSDIRPNLRLSIY